MAAAAILALAATAVGFSVPAASAAPVTETLSFNPVADVYVAEAAPDTSYGTSSKLGVDNSPRRHSFLRFNVKGIEGRTVTAVRLRLYQKDYSNHGGRVFSLENNTWNESMTWNTRPTGWEAGTPLAEHNQAVSSGNWYTFDLGTGSTSDGLRSFAMASPSSDGADWGSRTSLTPPTLEVDVGTDDTIVRDGLSEIAPPAVGSSSPTYHAINHRVAVTTSGRTLVLHGRHATGVQLAWRDPWATQWRTGTTGDVTDGLLLRGTGTGDWPSSIVLADDSSGEQHAWVIWMGVGYGSPKPIEMRRLSDLGSPEGPRVGPKVTVAPAGVSGDSGNSKADIAVETAPDGSQRAVITWLRRTSASSWSYNYKWLTDLDTDTPDFHSGGALFSYSSGSYQGTVEPTPSGVAWVGRSVGGKLRAYVHNSTAPLSQWTEGPKSALPVGPSSYPSAVALQSGAILSVVENDTVKHVVSVVPFSRTGAPQAPQLTLTGYTEPTIASDGVRAWIVMIRLSDGYVVSRRFDGSAWSSQDRVEIGEEGGGSHHWPNALRRADGRLRFIVEGPAGGTTKNAVLAFQRTIP